MNCRRFQDKLFEYVEGSLSTGELAAVEQHLSGCGACREAAQKEQQRAQALSARLCQSGKSLRLNPKIIQTVLAASRARPAATVSLAGLWMRWLRVAVVPVSFMLVAAILLAVHFSGRPAHERTSTPVITHGSTLTATSDQQPEISIELSYRLPVHEFHQEGNLVVDTFVDETAVANGIISSGGLKSLPQKLEIKTPL
jgi:anti-sigma-K factor RskA